MDILKLTDFHYTQLNPKIEKLIEGREWAIEDEYGTKWLGFWTKKDAERALSKQKGERFYKDE